MLPISQRDVAAQKHELATHTPKLTLIRFCRTLLSAVGGLSGQAHLPARLPPAAAFKYRLVNVKRASIREQSDRTVVVFPFSPGVASPSFNFNLPLTHRAIRGGRVRSTSKSKSALSLLVLVKAK